jgi:soluble lytic murein transglycosylase-like protein
MLKLTGVTAALAAGVMSFAATMANSAPLSPRADATPTIHRSAAAQKAEKPQKAVSAKGTKAEKTTGKKAKKQIVAQKKTLKKKSVVAAKNIDRTTTASIGSKQPAAARGGAPYSTIVARYAASYGVPVSLAHAVIKIESNYRANARGSAGEVGLMQIKPATARMLGYSGSTKALYDPETNIKYGMKYLAMAQDLGGGTTCGTILKYNAGHAATRMNPVSSAYCGKVKVQLAALGTAT